MTAHCPTCRCHPARPGRPRFVRLTLSLSSEADRRGRPVAEWNSEALEVLLVELEPVAGNGATTPQAALRAARDPGRDGPR